MSRILKNPPKGPHIEVNISTWIKDSHGLYDYEASEDSYKRQTFYIKSSAKVYRQLIKGDTMLDTKDKLNEANYAFIAQVFIDKSKSVPEFKVKAYQKGQNEPERPQIQGQQFKTTYLIVKEFAKQGSNIGYPLKPGNVIKLGRVQYMVIQAKNQTETFTLRDTNHFEETNGIFQIGKNKIDKSPEEGQNNCKVCLINDECQNDPLISPCNCKGSCRLIHVGCLRTWINSKVKKDLKGIAVSYNFTKFQCEICKFPFPKIVRFAAKDIEMMTITKPNKPYILLESLCNRQQNKEQRCLHLISTEQNTPIKIGRGHECEIRITDISVSRKHAEITLKQGEFYVTDTKAKFGTLIKLEQDFVLTPLRSIKIQCGRSVYEFKAKSDPQQDVDTQ